jgi:hypothetical protein
MKTNIASLSLSLVFLVAISAVTTAGTTEGVADPLAAAEARDPAPSPFRQRKTKKKSSGHFSNTENIPDALDQILEGATAGIDLLPIFAALALGSVAVPNPITNPLDFTTNPLVTALTEAASCADSEQASRDLAAALLAQFFGQARG